MTAMIAFGIQPLTARWWALAWRHSSGVETSSMAVLPRAAARHRQQSPCINCDGLDGFSPADYCTRAAQTTAVRRLIAFAANLKSPRKALAGQRGCKQM